MLGWFLTCRVALICDRVNGRNPVEKHLLVLFYFLIPLGASYTGAPELARLRRLDLVRVHIGVEMGELLRQLGYWHVCDAVKFVEVVGWVALWLHVSELMLFLNSALGWV